MRISDWSSDVCSSDLATAATPLRQAGIFRHLPPNRGLVTLLCSVAIPSPAASPASKVPTPDGDGHHPHPRSPYPQPEEHRPRPAARPADRDHRPVRLGQVVARLRPHLCRGPAPLRRVAVGVRAAIPDREDRKSTRQKSRPYCATTILASA